MGSREIEDDFLAATERLKGKRIKLLGKHPFAGESAEVVSFDSFGMRVKLLRMDAMYGHECYVTKAKDFRQERKGLDW
jgi:hypothetical protein